MARPPPWIDTQEQTPNLITVPTWETITAVSSIATTAVSSTALVLTTSGTISTHVSTITTTTNATTTRMSTNSSRRGYQRNSTALGLYFEDRSENEGAILRDKKNWMILYWPLLRLRRKQKKIFGKWRRLLSNSSRWQKTIHQPRLIGHLINEKYNFK